MYEVIATLNRSQKYTLGVTARERVLNVQNKRKGIQSRRGNGSFGELIPGETPIVDPGYLVARGPVATIEIGVEVKILAKAMIKQIDRVAGDLKQQVAEFKHRSGDCEPICVGIVAIANTAGKVPRSSKAIHRRVGRLFGHHLHPPKAKRRLESDHARQAGGFLIFLATILPHREGYS